MIGFSKWYCWLKVDEDTELQWIQLRSDAFFIRWNLSDLRLDEEGFAHATATHPVSPEEYPVVDITVDLLTGLLTAYQYREDATLYFYTLVGAGYVRAFSAAQPVG